MKTLIVELEDYDDEPDNKLARAAVMALFSAFEAPVSVTLGDTKLRQTSYASRDIADVLEGVVKAAGCTRWVRTAGGKTVHRGDCPTALRAKSTRQWPWADQFTNGQDLFQALVDEKVQCMPCSRCDPWFA